MLRYQINRSMNRILEGVDSGNTGLILEASNEFVAATEELKSNMKGFMDICKSFDEISSFVAVSYTHLRAHET